MWNCARAKVVWRMLYERWTDHTSTEESPSLLLPHIASRTPPTTTVQLRVNIQDCFGFFTEDHRSALHTVWQCITVLDHQTLRLEPQAGATPASPSTAGLGNPGLGGGGRPICSQDQRTRQWNLVACGYAYAGARVTNNVCEIAALRDGLAYARTLLRDTATHLEIVGDSNLIIGAKRGYATIGAPQLARVSTQITDIASHVAWTSWTHTKRANKMADRLANMAMDLLGAGTMTDQATGPDKARFQSILELKDNDMQLHPSPWRHTLLIKVFQQFQDS